MYSVGRVERVMNLLSLVAPGSAKLTRRDSVRSRACLAFRCATELASGVLRYGAGAGAAGKRSREMLGPAAPNSLLRRPSFTHSA